MPVLRHPGAEQEMAEAAVQMCIRDSHLPAHPGYYGEMVWILMMLEQWLQAHRGQDSSR